MNNMRGDSVRAIQISYLIAIQISVSIIAIIKEILQIEVKNYSLYEVASLWECTLRPENHPIYLIALILVQFQQLLIFLIMADNIKYIYLDNNYKMNEYQENMFQLTPNEYFPFPQHNLSDGNSIQQFQIAKSEVYENQGPQTFTKSELKTTQIFNNQTRSANYLPENRHKETKKSQIECSVLTKLRAEQIFMGSKDDTVQLNINFKTILVNHFKQLLLLNELTQPEKLMFQDFAIRSPSFKSLALFCQGSPACTINARLVAFVQSKEVIVRILQSRGKMVTKLQMIKFVQVLRKNILGRGSIFKWKQLSRG